MKYKIFTMPVHAEIAEAELNAFISGHKVINVQREFVSNRENSFWSFCVEYCETVKNGSGASHVSRRQRVDYKDALSPVQFAVFSRMRKRRKELADAEGRPAYAVCTDSQLAAMSAVENLTLEDLRSIDGVGDAKVKRYGEKLVHSHAGEAKGKE